MEMYIKPNHYKLLMIITNRDIPITKLEVEWTDVDLAIMELNTKARYTLTYALSKNEIQDMKIQDSQRGLGLSEH